MAKMTVKKAMEIIRKEKATISEGLPFGEKKINWSDDTYTMCCSEGVLEVAKLLEDGKKKEIGSSYYGKKYQRVLMAVAEYNTRAEPVSLKDTLSWIDKQDVDQRQKGYILELITQKKTIIGRADWKLKTEILGTYSWAKELPKENVKNLVL